MTLTFDSGFELDTSRALEEFHACETQIHFENPQSKRRKRTKKKLVQAENEILNGKIKDGKMENCRYENLTA